MIHDTETLRAEPERTSATYRKDPPPPSTSPGTGWTGWTPTSGKRNISADGRARPGRGSHRRERSAPGRNSGGG